MPNTSNVEDQDDDDNDASVLNIQATKFEGNNSKHF